MLSADEAGPTPRCTGGARACPPEDVGGAWGYEEFLEILADPDHEQHGEMVTWAGRGFDPEAFDLDAANAALSGIPRAPSRTGRRR